MATYKYTGFTKDGKNVKGVVDAASRQQALAILASEGSFVSDIDIYKNGTGFFGRIRRSKNLADLYFQLSLLLKSGIPLVEAINIIVKTTKNVREREMLMDTSGKVSEGTPFSEALSKHSEYFEPMYINLIKASERVGRLADVLMDIAEYEETKKKNSDKLLSALIYPATILFLGLGVLGFLLSVIVPKMQGVFLAAKQELPVATKALLGIAGFTKSYGIFIILIFILGIVFISYLYRINAKFRMNTDKKLFMIKLVSESAIARFSYILAFELKEGLPLTDSLYYAAETMQNKFLKSVLMEIREKVQTGIKFSTAVKDSKIFPELFPAAVSTGESSGNMPELLNRVNSFYGKKIEKYTQALLSILEPLFIVVIGALVAFVVISIMQPLFSINSFIQ